MSTIQFGNSQIKYKVKKSNRKTTEIVVSRNGVEVLSPTTKSSKEIKKLVKSHSRWIYRKKLWAQEENPHNLTYRNGSHLPYLGVNYPLIFEKSDNNDLQFANKQFVIHNTKPSKIKTAYYNWLKQNAKQIFENEIRKYSKKLKLESAKFVIRNMSTRWGSVTKKGIIILNQNLLRAPRKIIQYVIAHELCHLIIPNHSQKFWDLLQKIIPNYEESKEWLRINRTLLV